MIFRLYNKRGAGETYFFVPERIPLLCKGNNILG